MNDDISLKSSILIIIINEYLYLNDTYIRMIYLSGFQIRSNFKFFLEIIPGFKIKKWFQ